MLAPKKENWYFIGLSPKPVTPPPPPLLVFRRRSQFLGLEISDPPPSIQDRVLRNAKKNWELPLFFTLILMTMEMLMIMMLF